MYNIPTERQAALLHHWKHKESPCGVCSKITELDKNLICLNCWEWMFEWVAKESK